MRAILMTGLLAIAALLAGCATTTDPAQDTQENAPPPDSDNQVSGEMVVGGGDAGAANRSTNVSDPNYDAAWDANATTP